VPKDRVYVPNIRTPSLFQPVPSVRCCRQTSGPATARRSAGVPSISRIRTRVMRLFMRSARAFRSAVRPDILESPIKQQGFLNAFFAKR
jgi:hypothetical protein